jgi:hypothetical protein
MPGNFSAFGLLVADVRHDEVRTRVARTADLAFIELERHFDELTDVPNLKDLSPRLGLSYDLFGNGKTAVKVSLNVFVLPAATWSGVISTRPTPDAAGLCAGTSSKASPSTGRSARR